jgi:hypothetical protein
MLLVARCWDDLISGKSLPVVIQVVCDYHRTCAKLPILNLEYG